MALIEQKDPKDSIGRFIQLVTAWERYRRPVEFQHSFSESQILGLQQNTSKTFECSVDHIIPRSILL